jgi:hypothetical protein
MKSRFFAPIALSVAVLVMAGVNAAEGATTRICIKTSKGTVRITTSTKCASGEKLITLVPGPRGPEGPSGVNGDTGPRGLQGLKGDKGDTGDTGLRGIQGSAGTNGTNGAAGPAGPIGPAGPSLKVRDVNGDLIGLLVSTSNGSPVGGVNSDYFAPASYTIWDTTLNRLIYINEEGKPVSAGVGNLYFTNNDCTGYAYLNNNSATLGWKIPEMKTAATTQWWEVNAVIDSGATPVTYNSIRGTDGSCNAVTNTFSSQSLKKLANIPAVFPDYAGPVTLSVS